MIIFNLLPINGLDGYYIIREMLLIIFDEEYTNDITFYLSLITLFIVIIIVISFRLTSLVIIICYLIYRIIKDRYEIKKHNLMQYTYLKSLFKNQKI